MAVAILLTFTCCQRNKNVSVQIETGDSEESAMLASADTFNSEMKMNIQRGVVLNRAKDIYHLIKSEYVCHGGSFESEWFDRAFCSKSWNKLLMAVRSKEHNTGTLFFEVNKWTMTYDSDLVSFDEFEVQDLNMDANEMTATVNFTVYASDTYTPARIELVYEDGTWKIDNFYHLKYGLNLRSQMWDYLGNDLICLI